MIHREGTVRARGAGLPFAREDLLGLLWQKAAPRRAHGRFLHGGSSVVMFDWWMSDGRVSSDFIIAKIFKIYKIIKFDIAKNRSKKNDRFSSRPQKPPFLTGPQKNPLFRGKQQKSAIFPKNPLF